MGILESILEGLEILNSDFVIFRWFMFLFGAVWLLYFTYGAVVVNCPYPERLGSPGWGEYICGIIFILPVISLLGWFYVIIALCD